MDRLPCVLRIHGAPVASETVPGGPIEMRPSVKALLQFACSRRPFGSWRGHIQSNTLVGRLKAARAHAILANFGPTAVALQPAAASAGLPLVAHFHGFDAHTRRTVDKMREAYRGLGAQAAAIVVVSLGMQRTLEDLGLPPEKIHLARCGVDPERFPPRPHPPEKPCFVGVGRFVDKKAPYLTLLAFERARQRLPDARLILVGDGELFEATRNLATALRLDGAVEFPGPLPPAKVAALLQGCTAFVQHSLEPQFGPMAGDREGTPVAIMEAMMSAVPVISTRHAGIDEIVDEDRSGILVDERDVDGMAEAMVRLGADRSLALAMGTQARAQALAAHTDHHYLQKLMAVVHQVIPA